MSFLSKSVREKIINISGFDYPQYFKERVYKSWFNVKSANWDNQKFRETELSDLNENKLIFSHIGKSGGVMLDVGAMFGECSLPFLLHGNWKVHAFEPDKDSIKTEKLISLTGRFSDFKLHNLAVTSESGNFIDFFISPESKGISSTLNFTPQHQKSDTVKTVSLTDFLLEKKIDSVQFLKIDVEGADYEVLKGLNFKKCSPEVILIEFEDRKMAENTKEDIVDLLISEGYEVFASIWDPIVRYGVKHSFSRIEKYPFTIKQNEWGNFIAVDSRNNRFLKTLNLLSK
ncbi:MAG: hypothetical protein COA58_11780 [Bacteroidetes bacterium]|nr:MAG: hypothetical protein COA58_11780 [Bacteroidota bacterium]